MQVDYSKISLNAEDLKSLAKLNPIRTILVTLVEWALIFTAIAFHFIVNSPLAYLLTWLIISTRLYAMYSLIHEAIHYSLFKNQRLNDVYASIFFAFPLFTSLQKMRKKHLAHHQHLHTKNDPEKKQQDYKEFQFPKTKVQFILLSIKDILGINFLYYFIKKIDVNFQEIIRVRTTWIYLSVFVLCIYMGFGKELFLYWVFPYIGLYHFFNRLRLATEHYNLDSKSRFQTRNIIPSFIEKCIWVPYNLGYHVDHHLYPRIPFYRLPYLHQLLLTQSEYKNQIEVETSYFSIISKHLIYSDDDD